MKFHHKVARFFGYELINLRKHQPTLDYHLKVILDALKIDTVIDVGANKGQYGELLRQIGFQGKIYSFEPVSTSFEELKLTAGKYSDWQVFNYALGAENTEQEINVSRASEFSSLLKTNDRGEQLYSGKIPVTNTEIIRIRRLEDVLHENSSMQTENMFLKMDTQGYDLQVFSGTGGILSCIKGLQSEVSMTPIYQQIPDYIESFKTYADKGYQITGLYPVSRDSQSQCMIEMDCIMRRMPDES